MSIGIAPPARGGAAQNESIGRRTAALGILVAVCTLRRSASAEEREPLAGKTLDAALAEIARVRRTIRTMRADFTQERKLRLLSTVVRSTGKLASVAPDRLRWELAPPDDVIYWVGPEGLSYRTKSSKANVPAAGANVARALGDLRALLGGDLAGLGERYVLGGSRGPADLEITGSARDPKSTVRAFGITLDKTLAVPLRARLVEGKADNVDLVFANAQINVPIDAATMRP